MAKPTGLFGARVLTTLLAEGWAREQVELGIRAGFRCEYCGKDFLRSTDDWYSWQRDHIVPRAKGGSDRTSNKAVACYTCNFRLKGGYDPREDAGAGASRAALVAAVRRYVRRKRARVEKTQVIPTRRIVRPR